MLYIPEGTDHLVSSHRTQCTLAHEHTHTGTQTHRWLAFCLNFLHPNQQNCSLLSFILMISCSLMNNGCFLKEALFQHFNSILCILVNVRLQTVKRKRLSAESWGFLIARISVRHQGDFPENCSYHLPSLPISVPAFKIIVMSYRKRWLGYYGVHLLYSGPFQWPWQCLKWVLQ